MYENFTRLAPEEQQPILEACIEEFATHGFSQASTNAIIRRAGIPKGTLFFYFGSKKDLYLYVIDQAINQYSQSFLEQAGNPPADLFERLLYFGQLRMQFALREPLLYQLFFNAFINTPDEIRAELQARYAGYAAMSQQLVFAGLDRSPFQPDIQVEKVVELVFLVLEGIFSRNQAYLQSLSPDQSLRFIDQLTSEVRGYFEMVKKGVYMLKRNEI